VVKYKLSSAATNFSRNLISGGGFDRTFSLIPVNVTGGAGLRAEDGYELVYSGWRKKGVLLSKLTIIRFLIVATLLKICYESVLSNPINGNIPVYKLIILFALFYNSLFGRLERSRTKV
jgi:hypothetical protein